MIRMISRIVAVVALLAASCIPASAQSATGNQGWGFMPSVHPNPPTQVFQLYFDPAAPLIMKMWDGTTGAPVGTLNQGTHDFTPSPGPTPCNSVATPAVCGGANAGMIAVPTGTNPTLVVQTTKVTANSQIFFQPDASLATALGITCNTTTTTQGPWSITARTPGTSFTLQIDATTSVNKLCGSFYLIN